MINSSLPTGQNVYDIDFTRALPDSLKGDEKILALGKVIAEELQENIRLSRLNIIYPRIDELEENLLDILAHDLHIEWYDPDSPPDVKRTIIKNSVKVHKFMGTKFAVESVIRAYFGSGEVREWHEYGGEPHRFKIISGNPSLTNERIQQFLQMLKVVKRKSSWLDAILITLTGEMKLYAGIAYHDTNIETHVISPRQSNVLNGETNVYLRLIPHEISMERHTLYGAEYSQINKEGTDII